MLAYTVFTLIMMINTDYKHLIVRILFSYFITIGNDFVA